jgi:hypothetical protein
MSITPDDPRRVGGRYKDGYWGHEYMVIAIHTFDDWRGRSITVRWEEPCVWHPSPCVHAYTVTHSPMGVGRDRVIADPPRQAVDFLDPMTQTQARARLPAVPKSGIPLSGRSPFHSQAARASASGERGAPLVSQVERGDA